MGCAMKYKKYQDYVIRDGKFIGEFEEMYQDFDNPWYQSERELFKSEKAVVLNSIKKLNLNRVIELGSGLGYFSKCIQDLGVDVLGIDISQTAVHKASLEFPDCRFEVADILDFEVYKKFKPDVIVMSEITWYVLDKLDTFIDFFKHEMQSTYLIHLLNTYSKGEQTYGKEKFTNLQEIMDYFNANYLEWGEFGYSDMPNCKRTYFVGYWGKNLQ